MSIKNKKYHNTNSGFTIIEVLIFVILISTIFMTAAYLVSKSLYLTRVNEHKVLAAHYSEELREWLRGAKEVDWNQFKNDYVNGQGRCFNAELNPASVVPGPDCVPSNCSDSSNCLYNLDLPSPNNNFFKRYVIPGPVSGDGVMNMRIVTAWQEGGNSYSLPIEAAFSQYE